MIRAKATKADGGELVVLGIDKGNVKRLKQGKPIKVSLAELGIDADIDVVIHYRTTMRELTEEMAEFLGPGTKIYVDPKAADIMDGEPEDPA